MSTATATGRESSRSKRKVILDAAIDHFGEVGFEHTKWATVADEVGIGQTALYHYFESKSHCLLTIMRMQLDQSLTRFREVTSGVSDAPRPSRPALPRRTRPRRGRRCSGESCTTTWTCSPHPDSPSERKRSGSNVATSSRTSRQNGPR
ncbi:TetR/AcrR family transcriptional regulator [Allosalinactinospora lopnorensis]|uniref:TetR/AcrR family transcriptional regulator n=1 Tax=Allosalinactinospora lopnorensis TaxID=1352348 RepID=UPI00191BE651|nr:TetR/AcrR family transcriptional regulator [Allosalinactinospora lopnorensis]